MITNHQVQYLNKKYLYNKFKKIKTLYLKLKDIIEMS